MADWLKNPDGTHTYFGHGRCLDDEKLKAIMLELAVGLSVRSVATDRKLPVSVVQDVFSYFNKLAND
jgi:hypothetical protein